MVMVLYSPLTDILSEVPNRSGVNSISNYPLYFDFRLLLCHTR